MNIVYASDNNYVRPLGISIMSLLENNKEQQEINIFVIDNNIAADSKTIIKNIVKQYKRNIEFIDFNFLCAELKVNVEFPKAAYARLFLYKLNIDKALYLDSDTIINASLKELYEIDISNYEIAGVQDNAAYYLLKKIGMNKKNRYINSGVLLMNLDLWRKRNIGKRFTDFIELHKGKVNHHDQGTLNGVCKDSTLIIHPKYNMMPEMIHMSVKQSNFLYDVHNYYTQEEIDEAVKNPVVIHYIEKFYSRPWKKDCTHPLKGEFLKYLNKSEFDKELESNGLNKKILFRKKIYEKCPFIIYAIFEKILNFRRRFL